MGALRELLAKLDIEVTGTDKAKHAEGALKGFKKAAEGVAKFLAVGAIAEGVKSMVEGLEEQAVQLSKTSQILGINTQDLQAWQFAAKLSGVEADAFAGGVKKLEINAGKAAEAGAQTGGEFQKLGVNLREDAGGPMRDVQEILHDTGMAIARLPDPMTRADAVMKTFGKSGSALIPLFNKGEAGLSEMLNEIDKLGGGISEQAIGQLEEMHHATSKWDMALTSAKSALVVQFLPALTSMLSGFTKGVASILNNKVAMEGLKSGVIALGVVGAAAGLEFIAPWIPAIAGFVLLAAVVDEFRVGLAGGKTVIGDVLDKLFGEGAGKSFFVTVKADAEAFIKTIKELLKLLHPHEAAVEARKTAEEIEAKNKETPALTDADKAAIKARDKEAGAMGVGRVRSFEPDFKQEAFESEAAFRLRKAQAEQNEKAYVRPGATLPEGFRAAFAAKHANDFDMSKATMADLFDPAKRQAYANTQQGNGRGAQAPANVQQNANTVINITAPSGDAKDIADSAGAAVQEQNRANLAAVQTMVAK